MSSHFFRPSAVIIRPVSASTVLLTVPSAFRNFANGLPPLSWPLPFVFLMCSGTLPGFVLPILAPKFAATSFARASPYFFTTAPCAVMDGVLTERLNEKLIIGALSRPSLRLRLA